MPVTISPSNAADHPAIIRLLNKDRGDDMSKEERARQGFIQGNINKSMLTRFQAGSGVFVAHKHKQMVGLP